MRVCQRIAGKRQALTLAKTFVAEKEERLVRPVVTKNWTTFAKAQPLHRSGEVKSKLVSLEWRRFAGAVKEVTGVQRFIAKKFKELAVIIVGSGTSGDVNDRARVAPVLGAES